jgi:hypothetical protein
LLYIGTNCHSSVAIFAQYLEAIMPKRKLAELVGQTPVSYAGLSRLISSLRTDFPNSSSRQTISRAIQKDLNIPTPCGKLLQVVRLPLTEDRGFYDWYACHPGATLTWLCHYSPGFERTLLRCLEATPSTPATPWSICLYADEAAAGNLLRSDNTRKAWLIYWGFLEMGSQFLSHENNWMLLGVIRCKVADTVKGGLSGVLRVALNELMFGMTTNVRERGLLVKKSDGSVVGPVFAKLAFFLGDDAAITSAWRTKGAGGNSNCLLCQNVCNVRSELADHDESGYLVDHAEGDFRKFHLHTNQTIWSCFDRLLRTPDDQLDSLQIAFGLHGDPDSLLADIGLRFHLGLVSSTMFDFGHVFVIHGLCQFEMTEFLHRAKRLLNVKYDQIHAWFQAWTWPKSEHNAPAQLFNEHHADNDKEFKASSSECMSMYPVFRQFVNSMIRFTDMIDETRSLMSMFRILDGWKAYQAGRLGPVSEWQREIAKHHEYYSLCYGKQAVRPKHHRALHFGSMMQTHGMLQATMVHERRHKQFKEIAQAVKTGSRFDLTCTELLLNRQTQLMTDESQFAHGRFAVGGKRLAPDLIAELPAGEWLGHRTFNLDGVGISVGDVTFLDDARRTGEIQALLSKDGQEFFAIVQVLHDRHGKWHRQGLALANSVSLRSPSIWSASADGSLHILPPGDMSW